MKLFSFTLLIIWIFISMFPQLPFDNKDNSMPLLRIESEIKRFPTTEEPRNVDGKMDTGISNYSKTGNSEIMKSKRGNSVTDKGCVDPVFLKLAKKNFNYVYEIAKEYTLVILALIIIESGFNQYARSSAPAYGLLQLLLSTARDYVNNINYYKLYDPKTNLKIGVQHLKQILIWIDQNQPNATNKIRLIALYWNAGYGIVNTPGRLTAEHTAYADKVECIYKTLIEYFN